MMSDSDGQSRFKASGENAAVDVLCARFQLGDIPVCPKCGNDLIIAFTWDVAIKYGGHPGIFCLVDSRHFQVAFNVASKSSPSAE